MPSCCFVGHVLSLLVQAVGCSLRLVPCLEFFPLCSHEAKEPDHKKQKLEVLGLTLPTCVHCWIYHVVPRTLPSHFVTHFIIQPSQTCRALLDLPMLAPHVPQPFRDTLHNPANSCMSSVIGFTKMPPSRVQACAMSCVCSLNVPNL